MKKITVKVEGMRCGMCESHVNDLIRRNFNVKKSYFVAYQRRNRNIGSANHRP